MSFKIEGSWMLNPLFKGSSTRARVLTGMGNLPTHIIHKSLMAQSLGRGKKSTFTLPTSTPRVEGTSEAWAVLP